jgi:hypothetical protein
MMVTSPQSPRPVDKKYKSIEESQHDLLKQEVADFMKKNPNIPPYAQKSLDGMNPSEKAWTAERDKNTVGMRNYLSGNINKINQTKINNDKNQAAGKLHNEIAAKNFPRYIDSLPMSGPENNPPVIPPILSRYDKPNQDLLSRYGQFKLENPFTDSRGAAFPPTSGRGGVPSVGSPTSADDIAAMRRALGK